MNTIRTVGELRAALAGSRRAGRTIGLVPTMGALHEGHLSLIRAARADCDQVVVSLFVNPTQFNDASDLEAYPRDEARDAELAAGAGADYLFAPSAQDLYPDGFATAVSVAHVTEGLEGAQRGRGHFDGVATVVTKLFNIVAPDVAYFGQKDAQQTVVIKRLVRDLDLPVRIEVCPTVREPDGLALSSRNGRLSATEREHAISLHRGLRLAAELIGDGVRDAATIAASARELITSTPGVELEYFELVDPETLAPLQLLGGDVLAVVAARLGVTRLIDNQPIHVPSTHVSAIAPPTSGGRTRSAGEPAGSTHQQEALVCSVRC